MAPKRKGTSLSGATYQVFLSFRGPDTRLGFTDVIYHALTDAGIRVFRDNEEIRKGEDIGDEILKAIGESRILVPIFSSGYASSKWCLIELSKMFESKEASPDSNKKILPIFYDVDADDVKLKTQLYADPLLKHRERFSPDTVSQWEEALRKSGKIKGYAAKNRGHGEFAKLFVREVSMKLKVKHKFVTDYLVQRDEQVEALMRSLDLGASDVQFVGIHGMGGIGKTTLAKIAFNKLCDRFEHCSFLTDVRESCQRKGIEQLQKQLLGDLGFTSEDINHVEHGIQRMRELLPHKKVLIVLDDVDDLNQIRSLTGDARGDHWFGQGSRVIITTRNQQVLGRRVLTLEVDAMNPEEALQLFSMHAFDNDSPPIEHLSLSEDAVESTGRLPLALEVIGSHLRDIPHRKWAKTIERLKKVPHEEVQKKLMISYEALDHGTKQIFLDIACFFIGHEKTNPMYMWEACKFDAKMGLKKLIHKSLVKIDVVEDEFQPRALKVKVFGMHDQLRDLGRDIAKCSRMCMYEEALKVLDEVEGKANVEMLHLRSDKQETWNRLFRHLDIDIFGGKTLSGLGKLRHLQCIGLDLSDILPNLRWLSWQCCPEKLMGTGLSFKKLVILDLSHSRITEDWNGWSQIGVGNNLKVLDLTGCIALRKTPDFSKYSSLEHLILENCDKLVEIDPSIGKLKDLKFLNVNGCNSLKGLPEELCSLHCLEVILGFKAHRIYDGRDQFEWDHQKEGFSNLPELIGDLRSLLILVFHVNKIARLPESIIRLSRLRHISLRGIVELPLGVGLLENLEIMELIGCECMEKLPDSIGDMKSLLELKVSRSRITEIPETIGNLEQIRVISLSHSKIHKLPTSIGKLKRLEKLIFNFCVSLTEIPSTIKGCSSLRVLNLANCHSMKELPDSIWDLNLLTEFDLSHSGIIELPESIGNLNELRSINIDESEISKLPTSIGMLKKLEVLSASGCFLREIPATIHGCTGLRELNLMACESLKELPDSVGDLRSLHKLHLSLSGITKLPETIGNLKELRELIAMGCGLLERIPSTIERCTQLWGLDLQGCENIKELPVSECFLRSLRGLRLPHNLEKVFGKTQVSSESD